ncbi:hypothetical protein BDV96DRAFT_569283 [Lophiotrema nucula]|uniref:Uncharacterized protein n=1 Tax=Lophiotrema nucula TaxID=690887 RepID=A0A6A5ZG96_9PLEO|nr:hypothetical protein BDV96DRAFT_569283 [Lophiotrema nucula]
MLKAQVLRRSFSLFNRVPKRQLIRSATRDGHDTIQIQRVRFRQPLFSRSRQVGLALTIGITWGLWEWLDDDDDDDDEEDAKSKKRRIKPAKEAGQFWNSIKEQAEDDQEEGVEVEDDEEEEEDEDDEEEDEDDALVFLPTGFSRAKPRSFYKGTDPEWQEFVRIAPDRKRIDQVRGELISLVRDLAARNPHYMMRIGKIDPEKGAIWVEVKFPDGPPIEFERPGIEITEDLDFRWSTRPVHEVHHKRIGKLLMPTTAAHSLYLDTKTKVWKQWYDFKQFVGWEETKGSKAKSSPQIPGLPFPPTGAPSTKQNASATTPSVATPSATSETHQHPESGSPSPGAQKDPNSPLGNPAYERFGIVLPDPQAVKLDMTTFRMAFRKQYKPPTWEEPPRGSFLVHGLIEIIGSRGKMTLDVAGAYDPRIGQYVALRVRLRSILDYKQKPKGGP